MAKFLPSLRSFLVAATLVATLNAKVFDLADAPGNPCAVGSDGNIWVTPRALRACFMTHPFNATVRANVLEVVSKMLAFHTSTNYQIQAPAPFSADVHEDVLADLAGFAKKDYKTEYEFHLDVASAVGRLRDGHAYWENACYDHVFLNYLPTPLSLITGPDGKQNIHIAFEAFGVLGASDFNYVRDDWQNALPGDLKGQMESLSGARILEIDGKNPFVVLDEAVNDAYLARRIPAKSIRQNSFFGSYIPGQFSQYNFGTFALQNLPLSDDVTFKLLRVNHTVPEVVKIPYYAYTNNIGFNDTASWRKRICDLGPFDNINGYDPYHPALVQKTKLDKDAGAGASAGKALTSSWIPVPDALSPINQVFGKGPATFHMLPGNKTGVFGLGMFENERDTSFNHFLQVMVDGLNTLKTAGATQLIIDVNNNPGGYLCSAAFLHRLLIGPSAEPHIVPDSAIRVNPLVQAISKNLAENNLDPDSLLAFNSHRWTFSNGTRMPDRHDWLTNATSIVINGRRDSFSQRLGPECSLKDFGVALPAEGLFDPKNIIIIGNGFCGSACATFSSVMAKKAGVKTLIVGGVENVPQQYAGSMGGQALNFFFIQSAIKVAQLGNHTLAPPDLIVKGSMGINWRIFYGVTNTNEPEEWQSKPADYVLPITADITGNPFKIWQKVEAKVFH